MKPHFKLTLGGQVILVAEGNARLLHVSLKGSSALCDMHPADVIAALRKRGTSLRQIALQNEYSHIQRVLTSPWLAAEQLVARALEMKPEEVWPSRYLNPADRALAFKQTRKIVVTMPRKSKQASSKESSPPDRRVANRRVVDRRAAKVATA